MNLRPLIVALLLISCAPSNMIETKLYFGQSRPSGGMVTEQEWNNFREKYIARVFKEGSTIVPVVGNWLDPESHQLITEPTYVVINYYKKDHSKSQQIDSLRYWYKKLFEQQSVLRVDQKVRVSF